MNAAGDNSTDIPSFSFNIPTYNASEYLDACLNSIFSQDYPKDKIEVLVADGGSTDGTIEVAKRYPTRILKNPRRLVDYASKINAKHSTGDLFVAFAADNELASRDWLRKVGQIFMRRPDISACWCNMIASKPDPRINRYFELIKSDPFMFFMNRNLQWYLQKTNPLDLEGAKYYLFRILKDRPLIWGANGLTYRTDLYRKIMLRDEYIGDNDVFHEMVAQGSNLVAYSPTLAIYHHQLKSIKHWMSKLSRNYREHMIDHLNTRNMNWTYINTLRPKLLLWIVYCLVPVLSLSHAVYLSIVQGNRYWLYHPITSFLEASFLLKMTLMSRNGISVIQNIISGGNTIRMRNTSKPSQATS